MFMNYFNKAQKFYLVGIGGSGMNGIAEILLEMGYHVEGSDINDSPVITHLRKLGIKISIGHNANNIHPDVDVVIYSSAIQKNHNSEVKKAREFNIPVIKRSVMLAELSRIGKSIAVAGTHGKTTTTTMVGQILTDAGMDPIILVGGIIKNTNAGARWGNREYIIIEADEFDQSFLKLAPIYEIVTNIETDHIECYGSFEKIKQAFADFINKVPFYGKAAVCLDERGIQEILPLIESPFLTYSILTEQADFYARNIKFENDGSSFGVFHKADFLGTIFIPLPGEHNVKNALGAISIACELNIPFQLIKKSLSNFSNAKRRFEIIYTGETAVKLIDDYAHHPTEIQATLKAARTITKNRVIAIFQPHLYSRTLNFADEFGKAFDSADQIIVTDVYAARENPIEGISGELIVNKIKESAPGKNVVYIKDKDLIPEQLIEEIKNGDTIISLGAGDINLALFRLRDLLRAREAILLTAN